MNTKDEGDDDEDVPQLSVHSSAALQEFYAEQALLQANVKDGEAGMPQEDWVC